MFSYYMSSIIFRCDKTDRIWVFDSVNQNERTINAKEISYEYKFYEGASKRLPTSIGEYDHKLLLKLSLQCTKDFPKTQKMKPKRTFPKSSFNHP